MLRLVKRFKFLSGFLLLCLLMGVWSFLEPAFLRFKEENLYVPGLPPEMAGLKVALIADIHAGSPFITLSRVQDIVDGTNSEKPDLILLGGDYVIQGVVGGNLIPASDVYQVFNALSAPLGVFAVMGNHDHWDGYERSVKSLSEKAPNIQLLEDRAVEINWRGYRFDLLGISDYNEGQLKYSDALEKLTAPFIMGLTHSPDIFPRLPEKVRVTFAGHTHGGQVFVPFLGRQVVPSIYGKRYAMGAVEEKNRVLFISGGIGTSIIPVRFMTIPEVNILTLQPKR